MGRIQQKRKQFNGKLHFLYLGGMMRKVVLYICMSLDGYIADKSGSVDWISGDGSDNDNPGSYGEFFETIDTIIMGYKTYYQIVTQLSPEAWPYRGKKSFIITNHKGDSTEEICFTNKELPGLIDELKNCEGKNIWICGGANIANQLMEADLIDRYYITMIPIILGAGLPLFAEHERKQDLKLVSVCSYNGMTDLVYERRK